MSRERQRLLWLQRDGCHRIVRNNNLRFLHFRWLFGDRPGGLLLQSAGMLAPGQKVILKQRPSGVHRGHPSRNEL
jgi:hypothetical protein